MNRILVIGGTGTVGSQVLSQLSGDRRASPRDGAQSRRGSFAHSMSKWFAEILLSPKRWIHAWMASIRCFWCGPPRRPLLLPLWSGSRSTHDASCSSLLRSRRRTRFFQQPNPLKALFEQIERLIETSGLAVDVPAARNVRRKRLSWWAPQIRAGDVVRWPYLAAPTAPIDERDIAAVAVRALCEDGHAGAEYVLTGPQSLSQVRAGVHNRSRDRPLAAHRRDLARRGASRVAPYRAAGSP